MVTVTPGAEPVILDSDLRPGQHLAVLGADASGKAEVELAAMERCRLFCDEWEQASAGGELAGAVAAGVVSRDDVTQLGDVIAGRAEGRRSAEEITLFDSTGLAIQDLAIAIAVYEAWREGRIDATSVGSRIAPRYSGMLPCFRFGRSTRLVCSVRRARISFGRVSCGTITSSM